MAENLADCNDFASFASRFLEAISKRGADIPVCGGWQARKPAPRRFEIAF
jgi:hypothetical protein